MRSPLLASLIIVLAPWSALAADEQPLPPVTERFKAADATEEPDFQRHVSPLLGRLGCNGRACHGSFQGRGGFRLSLFGYDFKADHEALLKGEKPRVDLTNIDESLLLTKPTDADIHEGGLRYKRGEWEHHLLRSWVEAGAKYEQANEQRLVRLEVTPAEIVFEKPGQKVQLKAVAVWPNGTREDVTPLCRFQTNNEQICASTEAGIVTAAEPGDTHVVAFYDSAVVTVPVMQPVSKLVGDKYPAVATPTKIDELVVAKLQKMGIVPSELASDAEFLRRINLDLIGTLPSAAEVEAFLHNESPNKRAEKIEELLSTPAYAAWWTTKLCDFTGNSESQLNNVGPTRGASQEWYDWIYKRVAENVPYDQLAEGIVLAVSRKPGQSYIEYCEEMSSLYHKDSTATYAERPSMTYFWNRRNLRTPEERAIGFAYTFLGVRIQCAQCHKHPFDQWSKKDFEDFKAFFTGVAVQQNGAKSKKEYEELVEKLGIKDVKNGDLQRKLAELLKEGKTVPFPETHAVAAQMPVKDKQGKEQRRGTVAHKARLLGSEEMDLTQFQDLRQPLMDWLRAKDNPYFARAFVNRVWSNYFNVGIVQPPDDLSLANPPSNKPLLDYLTQGFVEHAYDMKWLHREIANSRTYQLTWHTNETNARDETNFSRSVPRRLPAEAAYDAVQMATMSDERAAQFKGDLKARASAVAGVTGQGGRGGNSASFALQVFGRSIRESNCDCDRSSEASLLQTVYLQNDNNVLAAIQGGKGTWIDDVSRQLSGAGTGAKAQLPKGKQLTQEIAQIKVRLDRAKKKGEGEEQVQRLTDRLAELTKLQQETSEKPAEEKVEKRQLPVEQSAELVKQLYLRTVSRYPTAAELDRCHEFLAEAATPVDGLRGLLWALINTKEFIVNH